MKLPQLESPHQYSGLYVFDFGEQVAIGYTADEIVVLLESDRYKDGKVYRIHRAMPDGTMELQGVSRERFDVEDGMFFYRATAEQARADFEDLCRLAAETPPPCRMTLHLTRMAEAGHPFMTAAIFPAEYTHDVAGWLNAIGYNGGDFVEGGPSQVNGYNSSGKTIIEHRQLWPTKNVSRPAEEVLATTHLPVQRKFA